MTKRRPTIDELKAAITRYLAAHPNAADTARGIHDLWLDLPEDSPATLDLTLSALLALEDEDLVEQRKAGKGAIWRLRRTAAQD